MPDKRMEPYLVKNPTEREVLVDRAVSAANHLVAIAIRQCADAWITNETDRIGFKKAACEAGSPVYAAIRTAIEDTYPDA